MQMLLHLEHFKNVFGPAKLLQNFGIGHTSLQTPNHSTYEGNPLRKLTGLIDCLVYIDEVLYFNLLKCILFQIKWCLRIYGIYQFMDSLVVIETSIVIRAFIIANELTCHSILHSFDVGFLIFTHLCTWVVGCRLAVIHVVLILD